MPPFADRVSDADLRRLLLIRHFELALLDLFAAGHVSGTTHTCLGQEHVPVALYPLVAPAFVFSNHRGHGHYLAQFDDPEGLLAEILGRAGAVCGGYGGSQHLRREGFCSTGVQGQNVAVALGAALHLRRQGRAGLAVVYIGDGTWGEGVVYEALNMAALWRTPLVVAVEHNGIAQSTPTAQAMAGSIAGRAAAFGARHLCLETTSVPRLRDALAPEIAATRDGAGPLVAEFRTGRLGPHSKGDDTRDEAELAVLRAADWHTTYARDDPERFRTLDDEQRERVRRVVDDVLARPAVTGGTG